MSLPTLSADDLRRYARHLVLPEVGEEGQRRLKSSSVLIVGAGGLGSPAALYLAAAGVGRLGIADFDRVEASNLQRQVLFGESDLGAPKAAAAAKRLSDLNPAIDVEVHGVRVGADNALLRNTVLVSEVETGKQTPFHVEIAFTPRSPNVTYGRGRWTPDGRAIVHVAIDEHGRTGLATQDFHPDRSAPETRRALVGFDGECVYESFGIAPDGRALTFSTIEQVRTIHLADHLTGMR